MSRKLIGVIACLFMVTTAVAPMIQATGVDAKTTQTISPVPSQTTLPLTRDGWVLQWSYAFGGQGHAEFAQPVGDINQDGLNEVILGGYENSGICRIYQYNTTQQTYVQLYSWSVQGGSYHSPSGACVVDLDEDGLLEFCVSWGYSDYDGVYAYKWQGGAPVQLDRYFGTGMDFVYDVYAVDYNADGHTEVLIANDPNAGGKHVTALGWDKDTSKFYYETSWTCPNGSGYSVPMVWSGDVDNDGAVEIIADVSDLDYATAGTWALNWNQDTQAWDGVVVHNTYDSGVTVFGDGVGDVNDDGTLEIGVGSYGGTPQGFLFEWDGSAYQQVWNGQYPGQDPVIESVAVGDADNDGDIEFCFGTGNVHVIGWNGDVYYEEATLTGPTNMLAGLIIGDCDSDGRNEVKGCEILGGTGSEFIWKNGNMNQRPVAEFSWVPQHPNLGQPVAFDASASYDPDGFLTQYQWDWDNDGIYDESYVTPMATHSWSVAGTYPVKLKVTDNNSAIDVTTKTLIIQNSAPYPPTIQAPAKGKPGVTYLCSFNATDPDGDDVYYFVDWGDNSTSGWVGPSTSGAIIHQSHAWATQGSFTIKAKAKDTNGAESNWSTLKVTMPLAYEPPHYRLFEWLFQRFPHAFPILRHLLGY